MDQASMQSMVADIYTTDHTVKPAAADAGDLMVLPEAARKCKVNPRTAKGWLRRGLLISYGDTPVRGGRSAIVSVSQVKAIRDMEKNKGGRPPKS